MKKRLLFSMAAASVLAANDTVVLDEVTTISTATKSEKNIEGVAASVEIITQRDIEKIGAQSLKDIFSKTTGLNIQYGTFPSASSKSKGSLTLRGMGAKGTLLLIDGRRVGGEVSNPYDLDRIPASSIEKIEIVKGPMSTLYGADATGGVVNIITKKPTDTPSVNFGIRYGQNGEGEDKNKNVNFDLRGKTGKLGYSFYINHTDTTPYTQKERADVYVKQVPPGNTNVKPSGAVGLSAPLGALNDYYSHDVTYKEESQILTYGGRVEYDIGDTLRAGLDINAFNEERKGSYIGYFHPSNITTPAGGKIPVYNIPVDSEDENDRLDIGADLKVTAFEDLILNFRAYRSYYEKRNKTTTPLWNELQYASQSASAQNGMDANVEVQSFETIANYMLNYSHLLTLGAEIRTEDREATVFTKENKLTAKSVDYKSFYLQDEWMAAEDLNIIAGMRYDDISNADSKATFKLGAIKNFDKSFNLRANFAQGYRTPDIRELYINKNTPAGMNRGADVIDAAVGKNESYDLKPEFSNSYEIGASGKIAKFRYDAALFYNDIEDMISEVNKGAYYTFENLSEAKTYGSEVSLSYALSDTLSSEFNWSELRTKNKQTGDALEFNPKRVVSIGVNYMLLPKLQTNLSARYIGEQFHKKTLGKGTPTETTVDATLGGYTVADLSLHYALNKTVSIYGGINNINDKKIDDSLGSSSGRYYYAGMKVSF